MCARRDKLLSGWEKQCQRLPWHYQLLLRCRTGACQGRSNCLSSGTCPTEAALTLGACIPLYMVHIANKSSCEMYFSCFLSSLGRAPPVPGFPSCWRYSRHLTALLAEGDLFQITWQIQGNWCDFIHNSVVSNYSWIVQSMWNSVVFSHSPISF